MKMEGTVTQIFYLSENRRLKIKFRWIPPSMTTNGATVKKVSVPPPRASVCQTVHRDIFYWTAHILKWRRPNAASLTSSFIVSSSVSQPFRETSIFSQRCFNLPFPPVSLSFSVSSATLITFLSPRTKSIFCSEASRPSSLSNLSSPLPTFLCLYPPQHPSQCYFQLL